MTGRPRIKSVERGVSAAQPARTPFLVACRACRHVWPAAWLPLPMADAGRLLQTTTCPSCAAPGKEILIPTKAQADAWHAGQGAGQ